MLYVSPSLFADEDTVAALGPVLHSLQSGATKGGLINIHLGETEHLEESPSGNASSLLCPPSSRAFKMNQVGLSREPAGRVPPCHFSTKKDKDRYSTPGLNPQPCGTLVAFKARCKARDPAPVGPSWNHGAGDLRPKTFPRSDLGSVSQGMLNRKGPRSQMDFTAGQAIALK